MSRPIAVGDLVQIIKWPCCGRYLGEVHTVFAFGNVDSTFRCNVCNAKRETAPSALIGDHKSKGMVVLAWLKRIPPMGELEGERTEESLKETA